MQSASDHGGSGQIRNLRSFLVLRDVVDALTTVAVLGLAKPSKDQQHYDSITAERSLQDVAAEPWLPSVLHQFAFVMLVVTTTGVSEEEVRMIHCFAAPLDMCRCVLATTVVVRATERQVQVAAAVAGEAAAHRIQLAVSTVAIGLDTVAHKSQLIAATTKAALV